MVKHIVGYLPNLLATLLLSAVSSLFFYSAPSFGGPVAEAASCECLDNACGPCEIETGVTFYSAKCGVKGEKVKSCKKPTCVAVENQPLCFAQLNRPSEDQEVIAPKKIVTPVEPQAVTESPQPVSAGNVVNLEGVAQVERQGGSAQYLKLGDQVFSGDVVQTSGSGKVKVRLKDGSDVIVAANSKLKIGTVEVSESSRRRKVMLDLLSGKVRSRVAKKYEGGDSFTVKTRTAVAGVRGTDFVASFTPEKSQWVSEVRTIEGLVHVEPVRNPKSDSPKAAPPVEISAGTYAKFVVESPKNENDEDEFFASIDAGQWTPVMKMKEDEVKVLDQTLEFASLSTENRKTDAPARGVASVEGDFVCAAPAGMFNQCSYTCEGENPKGEKSCRTDLSGVVCVRRLCRANGTWSERTILPSSEGFRCLPAKAQVGACENYW